MDRKLRKFHKRKQNPPKVANEARKQRLRMMHAELSIEEQIQLAANNKLYSNRNPEKGIRVVTVLLYFFSISLAAIILSVYYVYFWHPEYKNTTVIRNPNCEFVKEISTRTVNATELFYNKLLRKLRTRENRKHEKLKRIPLRHHRLKESIETNISKELTSNEFNEQTSNDYILDDKLIENVLFKNQKFRDKLSDIETKTSSESKEFNSKELNELIEISTSHNNDIEVSDELFK